MLEYQNCSTWGGTAQLSLLDIRLSLVVADDAGEPIPGSVRTLDNEHMLFVPTAGWPSAGEYTMTWASDWGTRNARVAVTENVGGPPRFDQYEYAIRHNSTPRGYEIGCERACEYERHHTLARIGVAATVDVTPASGDDDYFYSLRAFDAESPDEVRTTALDPGPGFRSVALAGEPTEVCAQVVATRPVTGERFMGPLECLPVASSVRIEPAWPPRSDCLVYSMSDSEHFTTLYCFDGMDLCDGVGSARCSAWSETCAEHDLAARRTFCEDLRETCSGASSHGLCAAWHDLCRPPGELDPATGEPWVTRGPQADPDANRYCEFIPGAVDGDCPAIDTGACATTRRQPPGMPGVLFLIGLGAAWLRRLRRPARR